MINMVETRVGQVAYSDAGEGPVVVLLHATLHDRRDFDAIVPNLLHDHRVIALDWPGHGDSPAPAPSYAPRQRLRRAGTRVSARAHPRRCHSYGCIVAQFRCARI